MLIDIQIVVAMRHLSTAKVKSEMKNCQQTLKYEILTQHTLTRWGNSNLNLCILFSSVVVHTKNCQLLLTSNGICGHLLKFTS